jgi:hypothetical protein
MEPQEGDLGVRGPEPHRAQQDAEVVAAGPQLRGDEDDVVAVVGIAMPAGPQSLAESFRSHRTGDFEYERLVELIRRHAARIAVGTSAALDALGSIPFGGETHAERDEGDAAEAVECPLHARAAEHVTAAGRQSRVGE